MQATTSRLPDAREHFRSATIATLVAAFADDPAVRRFWPGDIDYRRHFPGFLDAFGGRAFEAGVVDRDEAGRGAALWFPPGLEPDGEAIMAHLAASIAPERLAALSAGMILQGSLHPEEPHWYLPWIGVRPEAQGQGVGSALLARGLDRADAEGMPAYLEATSRRNAALYARHGFEVRAIVEAEEYPEIILMWRPPGGRPSGRPSRRRRWMREPAVLVRWARARRRRRALHRHLLGLDDHLLQDIGFDREVLASGSARSRTQRPPLLFPETR
jgi:ribosomal protein S18 acetylase RimI-like enzyme